MLDRVLLTVPQALQSYVGRHRWLVWQNGQPIFAILAELGKQDGIATGAQSNAVKVVMRLLIHLLRLASAKIND